jgi:hypothetical protein
MKTCSGKLWKVRLNDGLGRRASTSLAAALLACLARVVKNLEPDDSANDCHDARNPCGSSWFLEKYHSQHGCTNSTYSCPNRVRGAKRKRFHCYPEQPKT